MSHIQDPHALSQTSPLPLHIILVCVAIIWGQRSWGHWLGSSSRDFFDPQVTRVSLKASAHILQSLETFSLDFKAVKHFSFG